jgi:hypothetical protein
MEIVQDVHTNKNLAELTSRILVRMQWNAKYLPKEEEKTFLVPAKRA